MQFEWAFGRARVGQRIRRAAWGEDDWVVMQKGYPTGIPINRNTAEATKIPEGTTVIFSPYLTKYSWGDIMVAWTPDQWDLFAEDWQVIHGDGTQDGVAPTPGAAYEPEFLGMAGPPIMFDDMEPPFAQSNNPTVIGYNFENPQA